MPLGTPKTRRAPQKHDGPVIYREVRANGFAAPCDLRHAKSAIRPPPPRARTDGCVGQSIVTISNRLSIICSTERRAAQQFVGIQTKRRVVVRRSCYGFPPRAAQTLARPPSPFRGGVAGFYDTGSPQISFRTSAAMLLPMPSGVGRRREVRCLSNPERLSPCGACLARAWPSPNSFGPWPIFAAIVENRIFTVRRSAVTPGTVSYQVRLAST